jgi:hypothetical protein
MMLLSGYPHKQKVNPPQNLRRVRIFQEWMSEYRRDMLWICDMVKTWPFCTKKPTLNSEKCPFSNMRLSAALFFESLLCKAFLS